MASLHLLRGAVRSRVATVRPQSHFTVEGSSATITATTSSCYNSNPGCKQARGRYPSLHGFKARNYPRFTASGSMKSEKASVRKDKKPSVLEVQRAIGVVDGNEADNKSKREGSDSFMDLLASTPIGQEESSVERKIRETAEWVVDRTESRALEGQKVILTVCMMILPVWVFLLLVASGIIQLPFRSAFLDNLLS